jgi:hypothetical protein
MKDTKPLSPSAIVAWHRKVCPITEWLAISGDLPMDSEGAAATLDDWLAAGVTDIVDLRGEWSDEAFVAQRAPHIRYHYFGTHDNGGSQDAEWFAAGIEALHAAIAHPGTRLMVHCHMGVNRGPSMAFAMLLDRGWDVIDALNAIRDARPIAGIIYADSAICAVGERQGRRADEIDADRERAAQWFDDHHIDIHSIIRRIRQAH